MIIFRNQGLIDLDAVRTMGVSVKNPGSFGFFGTGLKFAIATVLRGGGEIAIWRDGQQHQIGTTERMIREQAFDLITLDGEPIGITTQLGKNWEPWMVLRELGCNAKDEGGDFIQTADDFEIEARPGWTVISVKWAALDDAYEDRGQLFLETKDEPAIATESLRAFDRPSPYLYYRGVRVYKLDKPSRLTYDLLSHQTLTEDRTLAGVYMADYLIKSALLACPSRALIYAAITAGDGYHENALSFDAGAEASKAFIDAALDAKEKGAPLPETIRRLVLKHMREKESYGGGVFHRIISKPLEFALEALGELGLRIDLAANPVIVIKELPVEGMRSMAENGRIYLLDSLLTEGPAAIATEIIKRWVDLNSTLGLAEEAVDLLAPMLIKSSERLSRAADFASELGEIDDEDIAEDPEG